MQLTLLRGVGTGADLGGGGRGCAPPPLPEMTYRSVCGSGQRRTAERRQFSEDIITVQY